MGTIKIVYGDLPDDFYDGVIGPAPFADDEASNSLVPNLDPEYNPKGASKPSTKVFPISISNSRRKLTMKLLIVGAKFRPPALGILEALPLGQALVLRPEPTNPYDPNAIQVLVETNAIEHTLSEALESCCGRFGFASSEIFEKSEWHLGYIPRGDAAELAPKLGQSSIPGTLTATMDGKPAIEFTLPEGAPSNA